MGYVWSPDAFPYTVYNHGEAEKHYKGMSLRDWFAGMALPACAYMFGTPNERGREEAAAEAYRLADKMLEERKK